MLKIEINGKTEWVRMCGTTLTLKADMLRTVSIIFERLTNILDSREEAQEQMCLMLALAVLTPEEVNETERKLKREAPEWSQKAEEAFEEYIIGRA